MTISPDIQIMTTADFDRAKNAAFQRGVERGRFEQSMDEPFGTAIQIIELGCHLFWGRNGDMTHMDTDEFRDAHFKWYERAKQFIEDQRAKAALASTIGEK